MSATELILRDPLGERSLTATDFPVSIGGAGHTVVLPGAGAGTLAWIALHDGQLFLQPDASGAEPPLCNGAPVTRATWLRAGDVIDVARGRLRVASEQGRRVLLVEDGSGGNLTVPPEAPLAQVVSGGGDEDDERVEAVAFRRPVQQAQRKAPQWAAAARWRTGRGAALQHVVFRDGTGGADRRRPGRQHGALARRACAARRRAPVRARRRLRGRDPAPGLRHAARAASTSPARPTRSSSSSWQSCQAFSTCRRPLPRA